MRRILTRLCAFVLVGAGTVLLASTAMAAPADDVSVCHVPQGNPYNAHVISVSKNSLPPHRAHWDTFSDKYEIDARECTCWGAFIACALAADCDNPPEDYHCTDEAGCIEQFYQCRDTNPVGDNE